MTPRAADRAGETASLVGPVLLRVDAFHDRVMVRTLARPGDSGADIDPVIG